MNTQPSNLSPNAQVSLLRARIVTGASIAPLFTSAAAFKTDISGATLAELKVEGVLIRLERALINRRPIPINAGVATPCPYCHGRFHLAALHIRCRLQD